MRRSDSPTVRTLAATPHDAAVQDLLRRGGLPRHVAIIMDGNGRWAERQGLTRLEGHRAGAESVRTVTRMARRLGLDMLTLYAFSEQNWSRPSEEIEGLLQLLVQYLGSELDELRRTDVRLVAIGNLSRLPLSVQVTLQTAIAATRENRSMKLGLCLSYGGREEIVHAARSLAERVARRELRPEQIDEAALDAQMWTAGLGAPPDLLLRTSGEQRLSNFLLWQSAYSELYFTPTDWPDFRETAFAEALLAYGNRERRFGGLGANAQKRGNPC